MLNQSSRRAFLRGLTAGGFAALATSAPVALLAADNGDATGIDFGFSLYGMRALKVSDALKVCAETGYNCVELVAVEGWPCDPATFSTADRAATRKQLEDLSLSVPAIMEDLQAVVDNDKHRQNLDRLKAATELGHAVSPDKPPVIETVLGGSPKQWDALKGPMVRALSDWAKVGESTKSVIAAKAHVSGALHTPDDALWLVREVGSPWLKLVYDYSHFQLQGMALDESLKTMLPETTFIHVKDTQGMRDSFRFLLPGDGNVDYRSYFQLLKDAKYPGAIVVEVSGQVHGRPNYDPIATAKRCHTNLARLLD